VASGLARAASIALLNLSLVLALGSLAATAIGASALPTAVVAAFIASTLGGLIVALLVRAPAEISGAATSVTIIYAALAADLVSHAGTGASVSQVWAGLSIAVILGGVFVSVAGYAGLAGAIKFMPAPVTAGFVTGLGLGVIWSQLGPLLGLDGRLSSHSWGEVLEQTKPASLAIGAATAFVMWISPKLWTRAQPTLVALAAGTVLYYVVAWVFGPHVLGHTLGRIAPFATSHDTVSTLWSGLDPASVLSTAAKVAPYSAFLALQIVMNGAVTAASVGALLGTRSDVNRTLKTQGWTNVLCGALGSLPVTTVASVSLPAARMRGVTPAIAAASCVMLFVAVLVAGDLLAGIPVAVLSGILIVNGVAMIDRWAIGLLGRLRSPGLRSLQVLWNLAIVAAVAAAFNFGSVPLALFVGAILAMVLLALSLSEATTFGSADAVGLASTRVWSDEQAQWLAGERRRIAVFRPRGSLFFGTADELAAQLEGIDGAVQFVVLDLARVTTVDATACQIIAAAAKKLDGRRVRVMLAGVAPRSARARELAALGLTYPDRRAQWLLDLDHALERVELALLAERWPSADMQEADLARTALTKGLTQADLAALRSYMTAVEVPAGPLFKRGDPGNSMFVVDRGFIEIRIGSEHAPNSTRLAAFGPGSIFGEIALLNSEERTADAVCLEPSRLYELTREGLAALESASPALYTRIMENLNRHLAARLIVATSTVQTHR
jgi:MFS superfamily sulfate permease-like transporter